MPKTLDGYLFASELIQKKGGFINLKSTHILSLKTIPAFVILFLFSVSSYAHPGKTNKIGGHKCWKNCNEWELRYGEYHLHDKDWKPVKVDKKGNPLRQIQSESIAPRENADQTEPEKPSEQTPETASSEQIVPDIKKADETIINENSYSKTVYESDILPFNIILLIILAVLLLIALIFIRKKKGKD